MKRVIKKKKVHFRYLFNTTLATTLILKVTKDLEGILASLPILQHFLALLRKLLKIISAIVADLCSGNPPDT
jgi:hypothetical protein